MKTARATVYQHGSTHVDVILHGRGWLAEVQLWDGARWPKIVRRWYAAGRRWIPWFSLERQVQRAVTTVIERPLDGATRRALLADLVSVRRRLRWELRG